MACNQGEADQHGVGIVVETNNSARQDYVIRATSNVGSIGLVYSLVCPYPVGQTNLDWSTFILSSQNANLALFLAAVIGYQSSNPQSLVANSIGDALYSIAVTTTTSLSHGGPLDRRLLEELYWRGVIEFSGTRSPTYLYTVLPVMLFALFTYAAIGYSLWHIFAERKRGHKFATFGPTDPIHLIMVSSMREPGGKEA
ncbi:hypothetical protein L210DRAFT_3508754 [Boletus edulis BED1]|uniref:Uncharacterized protein n=1 Tax=Boletus edulis BED1 TaxID=1328754 RepID=A0AAD4BGZ6_BOLED|nr:hypothetical protein L210DRAFT_3508754 [Boletus edulis BED1]